MKNNNLKLKIKTIVIFILTILSISSNIIYIFSPDLILNNINFDITILYLLFNLTLLILSLTLCFGIIKNGIVSIFTLKWNPNCIISFSSITVLIQCISCIILKNNFINNSFNIYSSTILLGLFFYSWAELSSTTRISKNYKFVSSLDELHTFEILDNNISSQISNFNNPIIVFDKKIDKINNFTKSSHFNNPGKIISHRIAPVSLISCITIFFITLFVSQSILTSLTSLSLCVCICTPFSMILSVNLPLKRSCNNIIKSKATILNANGFKKYSNVNGIIIDSSDLYKSELINLQGIKSFKGTRIDESLLNMSAIMNAIDSPLKQTFSSIIKNQKKVIPKATNVIYKDNEGLVGWVNNKRVLCGNRKLLSHFGILPPSHEYEKRYLNQNSHITYFAIGGELVAMFVLKYIPEPKLLNKLKNLEENNISLFIQTNDSNITPELIAKDFQVSLKSLKILSSYENELITQNILSSQDDSNKTYDIVSSKKIKSLITALCECSHTRSKILLAATINSISIALGFSLIIFLILTSGIAHIGNIELFFYVLFWALASIVTPLIAKL